MGVIHSSVSNRPELLGLPPVHAVCQRHLFLHVLAVLRVCNGCQDFKDEQTWGFWQETFFGTAMVTKTKTRNSSTASTNP